MDPNQDGPRGPGDPPAADPEPPPAPVDTGPPAIVDATPDAAGESNPPAAGTSPPDAVEAAVLVSNRARSGLLRWGGVTLGGVLVGALAGRGDIAPFLALAAFLALAYSWDARDRARTGEPAVDALLQPDETARFLRALVGAIPALLGAAGFAALALYASGLSRTPAHAAAAVWCVAATGACFSLAYPPVADRAARLLVPFAAPSHVARATVAIAVPMLLFPVPVRLLFDELSGLLGPSDQPLVEVGGLLAQLAGELAIALAAVGLWISRGARAAGERLGLGPMGPREWAIAALGLGLVTALNGGLESLERAWLPELWRADQEMSRRIVGDITLTTSLVLGLSAGVGEEVLVRGALQPRTGLLWASVMFGAAHVQYTWFGMLVIVLLGVTLGLVRRHANTTTAIVVHGAYDIVAALGARG